MSTRGVNRWSVRRSPVVCSPEPALVTGSAAGPLLGLHVPAPRCCGSTNISSGTRRSFCAVAGTKRPKRPWTRSEQAAGALRSRHRRRVQKGAARCGGVRGAGTMWPSCRRRRCSPWLKPTTAGLQDHPGLPAR